MRKSKFEDTKGAIRSCNSKDRQHERQTKVNKIQRKLKIEQYEPYLKTEATVGVREV